VSGSQAALAELGRRGGAMAFEAAALYVEALQAQPLVAPEAFAEVLARHIDQEFDRALGDAAEAWQDGLEVVAFVTFEASMRLAGIRAAKEYLGLD